MDQNPVITDAMIQKKAYELWEARGCPHDCPEVDWYAAQAALHQDALAVRPGVPEPPRREGKKYGLREIGPDQSA